MIYLIFIKHCQFASEIVIFNNLFYEIMKFLSRISIELQQITVITIITESTNLLSCENSLTLLSKLGPHVSNYMSSIWKQHLIITTGLKLLPNTKL